jgi:hypothetical protein
MQAMPMIMEAASETMVRRGMTNLLHGLDGLSAYSSNLILQVTHADDRTVKLSRI